MDPRHAIGTSVCVVIFRYYAQILVFVRLSSLTFVIVTLFCVIGVGSANAASSGSVSLDRSEYPIPFGIPDDYTTNTSDSPSSRSLFPIHFDGLDLTPGFGVGEYLDNGDLTVHIRVNDPDFNISSSSADILAQNTAAGVGPVKISVIRGSDEVVLGYAGGSTSNNGLIDVDDDGDATRARQFGPMTEIARDEGIFKFDLTIRFTDGPASDVCPTNVVYESLNLRTGGSELNRFDAPSTTGDYCILQGDMLKVEYTDPADSSGNTNTVVDSAIFDLKDGVLQTEKTVYIIGTKMILTVIELDFDLDSNRAENYDLDLVSWDSDAATTTLGNSGGLDNAAAFDPYPSTFRETGDSTGIFQATLKIPRALNNDPLDRAENIILEYTDWSPSTAAYVGGDSNPVNTTIFTSDFGANITLDSRVYTWTDKVYITIIAPDHNFDPFQRDVIGDGYDADPLKISTRGHVLNNYKLVESGVDTNTFVGEVILSGFADHDADGDGVGNDASGITRGEGPTDGQLSAEDDDGLIVSFEFSEDRTVTASAIIRWNTGEVQWLESSYPASGTGIVRVIEPDLNLDPDAIDTFNVNVRSDSSVRGIDLTVTETDLFTGIFKGTVNFTTTGESSGTTLRVTEGDTITAEYEDHTLPDPYTTADTLGITATSQIQGTAPTTTQNGVTVEFDQPVYTWTDKVGITITAPDYNLDSNQIDEIGGGGAGSATGQIQIETRIDALNNYKLVETGTDTGIFFGTVSLTGFASHDADGDRDANDASGTTSGSGPTDGMLAADSDDGLEITFTLAENRIIIANKFIRWNIGEIQWLESGYPASGTGVIRVIEPDLNLNQNAVDTFNVDVWSDSDPIGIDLTVTETDLTTGIFKGTVSFTTTGESSGTTLRVTDGDTVTAEYYDHTLPDPYTIADSLDIVATSIIGGTSSTPTDSPPQVLPTQVGVVITSDIAHDTSTSSGTISYTATFDEGITGFDSSNISISGTSGVSGAANLQGVGTTYTFDVTATTDGTVIVLIPAAAAVTTAGNKENAQSNEYSITIDTMPPQFQSAGTISGNATEITFSEPITGTASNSDFAVSNNTISSVSVADSITSLTLDSTILYGDTITVSYTGNTIMDTAGNILAAFTDKVITNNIEEPTTPSATIASSTADSGETTGYDTISYTATFSEDVTGFEISDISVSGNAELNTPAVSNFAGSGTSYTFDIQATSDGTVSILILQNAADSVASIGNTASATYTVTVNTTAPTVSSVSATSGGTYKAGDTLLITVEFNHSVTVSGTPQLKLETGSKDAVAKYTSGSPGTSLEFTYVVSDEEEAGDLDYVATDSFSLNGGTISSTLNSATSAILSLPPTGSAHALAASDIVVDTVAPRIVSIKTTSDSAIRITASEPLAGNATASDYTVSGITDNTVSGVAISGSSINVTVDGKITPGDKVKISYLGSSITDIAGNTLGTLNDRTITNNLASDSPASNSKKPANSQVDTPTQPTSSAVDTPTQPASSAVDTPTQPASSAVDTPTQPASSAVDTPTQPANNAVDTPTQPDNKLAVEPEPTCGRGTHILDGICVVDSPENTPPPLSAQESEPICGSGTHIRDGICVVDDQDDIFSIILSFFAEIMG